MIRKKMDFVKGLKCIDWINEVSKTKLITNQKNAFCPENQCFLLEIAADFD